jgi:hypothetical protein
MVKSGFGFLYLFPIMLAAGFLPRWAIALMGIACALLSERLSNLDPADAPIRTSFEALALAGSWGARDWVCTTTGFQSADNEKKTPHRQSERQNREIWRSLTNFG